MRHRGLCFPTVTDLYWGIDLESDDDTVTFIGAFPAVQRFYMLDTGDTILDTLIGSTKVGFQALWRHMHTIHLDAPNIPKARQLVESRKNAGMPLRCLRMRKPKPKGHISDLHWLSSRLKVLWVPYDRRIFESTE
ncbi:hypothetical protein FIBSPDRAFT_847848 [Athelia psychrophila]|uniref:Uncharacterized protein n=1 Tax=Athelia psychrophila TaxID=1759441 RepID=A0A166VZY7_9AGAM|nr:hypothetical protein FIBSPDRAFT_847848 [Fibularhizoctonia sp. CBS 109695]